MSSLIVAKFGGSSVKDGEAMKKVAKVVGSDKNIKIVIISATHNTTNQLEFVANASLKGDETILNQVLAEIESKHFKIASDLNATAQTLNELKILNQEIKALSFQINKERSFSSKTMDALYRLGERMSSLLIADYLRQILLDRDVKFIDARKVIKTNSEFKKAEPQIDLIAKNAKELIADHLKENTVFVTQGFIGEDLQGQTTTLGREGSDYSAALLGEALNAALIQIWTDVEGIASSDPRLIANAKFIKTLSYDEATALASLGAKVLFPRTLLPAQRKSIPVFVGSTARPELGGTIITGSQDATFSLKGTTLMDYADGSCLVSIVGPKIYTKNELADNFIKFLAEKHFHAEFFDRTSVSVTLKVQTDKKDELLSHAHDFIIR